MAKQDSKNQNNKKYEKRIGSVGQALLDSGILETLQLAPSKHRKHKKNNKGHLQPKKA